MDGTGLRYSDRMARLRTLLLTSLAALAFLVASSVSVGAAARATGDVDSVTVAMGAARSAPRHGLPIQADLVGASWRGATALELRTRSPRGVWSEWVTLESSGDAPDPGSAEARRAARRTGGRRSASSPVWVGAATSVQVRPHGRGSALDVRVVALNATGTATRAERLAARLGSTNARLVAAILPRAGAQPYAPGIRSRASWGAASARATPVLAQEGVLGAVVHHTAGTNRYSCAQVPALLRGIQRYHMSSNGWNDIGYNYLVDACGGVWEGRGGGITRPVIGAHTAGFNTSTTGVALIGMHGSVRPTLAARRALTRLLAWRLDVAHVKPTGTTSLVARSADKFPLGSRVTVSSVSGHRDLFLTSCPGAVAYRDLRTIAAAAWASGGPKVANVARAYTLAAPADPLDATLADVRVRAVGTTSDMSLTVRLERISTLETLHEATVVGAVISSTWLPPAGVRIPAWDVRVVVTGDRAGVRARAASFALDPSIEDPGLSITATPSSAVTIGGDPADDAVHLGVSLQRDFRIAVTLDDPSTGAQVAELRAPAYLPNHATAQELQLAIPASVAAGRYELRVSVPADDAAGRSVRRFTLDVSRAS
ncbi:MAG: hypothetical protein JWM86_2703 [Thermoleophilia bacterium]|nr:hypothetical protein [Thermoleophilia bacterium]